MYIVFRRDLYSILRTAPTHLILVLLLNICEKYAASCKVQRKENYQKGRKKRGLDFSKVRPSICLMNEHEDFDFLLPFFFFLSLFLHELTEKLIWHDVNFITRPERKPGSLGLRPVVDQVDQQEKCRVAYLDSVYLCTKV